MRIIPPYFFGRLVLNIMVAINILSPPYILWFTFSISYTVGFIATAFLAVGFHEGVKYIDWNAIGEVRASDPNHNFRIGVSIVSLLGFYMLAGVSFMLIDFLFDRFEQKK